MKPSSPTIILRNNSDYTLLADLGNRSAKTITNQSTQYAYDISAETYSAATYVSIQAKANTSQEFITYSAQLLSATPQGVAAALSTLGLDSFSTLTDEGVTTVVTFNDKLIFGTMSIFNPLLQTFDFFGNTPGAAVDGTYSLSINFAPVLVGSTPLEDVSYEQAVSQGDFLGFILNLSPSNISLKFIKIEQLLVSPFTITTTEQIIPPASPLNNLDTVAASTSYQFILVNA